MREERIAIGGHELVLARPDDPESLIDEEPLRGGRVHARTGPSCGRAASRSPATSPDARLAGRRVLELGCGLGAAVVRRGARGADVLATDWAPEALDARRGERGGERVVRPSMTPLRRSTGVGRASRPPDPRGLRSRARRRRPLRGAKRRATPRPARRGPSPGGIALVADPGRRHAPAFFEARRPRLVDRRRRAPELPSGASPPSGGPCPLPASKTLC